jgi:hypothetical protein
LVAQERQDTARVETPAFAVPCPEGKGWTTTVFTDTVGVEFTRSKSGFPGVTVPEVITIDVLLDSTTADNAARGVDSVAEEFMNQEEAQLRAGTYKSFKQDVVLKRAGRSTDSIGPYHLYVFEPTIQISNWQGTLEIDERLNLYFPPDFDSRHQFFLFLIIKGHPPKGGLQKRTFKEIRPIVAGFQDTRPPVP